METYTQYARGGKPQSGGASYPCYKHSAPGNSFQIVVRPPYVVPLAQSPSEMQTAFPAFGMPAEREMRRTAAGKGSRRRFIGGRVPNPPLAPLNA